MSTIRTQDVVLLVKTRLEDALSRRVHVMTVCPDEPNGWAVFVECEGIVWKQRVSCEGTLGFCSRQYPQLEMVRH